MPVGLQVFNENNIVQIDSNYRNNALVRAGPYSGTSLVTVTVSGQNPLIFFRSEFRTILTDRRQTGSTFTFYFYPRGPGTYYIFDVTSASGGFGLQIFTSSGELAFDSSRNYLRVVALVQLDANYSNSERFLSVPGKSLAVMGSGWAQDTFSDETGMPGYYEILRARNYIRAGAGGYTVVQEEDSYFSSTPFDTSWSATALVADVTNYPVAL